MKRIFKAIWDWITGGPHIPFPEIKIPDRRERIVYKWRDETGLYEYALEQYYLGVIGYYPIIRWQTKAWGDRALAEKWADHYGIEMPVIKSDNATDS